MTWILTRSGIPFDLLEPAPDMVQPMDIAHALAHLCRFNGHTLQHYSVAEHSIRVAKLVPAEHRLAALLHDATEAYVGDMVRPLKQALPAYQQIEQQLWQVICQRFDVDPVLPACVHEADMVMLATERRDLMPDHAAQWECLDGVEPLRARIVPCNAVTAQVQYFNLLMEQLATTNRRRALGGSA